MNIFAVIGVVLSSPVHYPLPMFIIGWIYGALVALVVNLVFGTASAWAYGSTMSKRLPLPVKNCRQFLKNSLLGLF